MSISNHRHITQLHRVNYYQTCPFAAPCPRSVCCYPQSPFLNPGSFLSFCPCRLLVLVRVGGSIISTANLSQVPMSNALPDFSSAHLLGLVGLFLGRDRLDCPNMVISFFGYSRLPGRR